MQLTLFTKNNKSNSLLEELTQYTDSAKYDTTYYTHGIHSYSAKYIPQLPQRIILQHTTEKNMVLDPFCGSGTTLLECALLGRKSIGIDSNPIATLISRAKTQSLNSDEIDKAKKILEITQRTSRFIGCDNEVPSIPKISHWFQDNVINELAWIKSLIKEATSNRLKDFLFCIFSSIIVSVSNQESETRYAAINKNVPDNYTIERFSKKLKQELENIRDLSSIKAAQNNAPIIYTEDARYIDEQKLPENSIDLIITSPPYPNSYDYYLYHKFRMYWLDYDPQTVKNLEIGSRNEHSSRKASIDAYIQKMIPVFRKLSKSLKPSKLSYIFVGDAIIGGSFINIKETFQKIIEGSDLKFVADGEYSLDSISRSFHEKRSSNNKNKYHKMQRILVFEKIVPKSKNSSSKRLISSPKSTFETMKLEGIIPNKEIISIHSDESDRHIHTLGKYPSKYIPDIPKWAISLYSKLNDTIFDPFVGSGTTPIEALILSRNAVSSDYSPYACLLTQAKTTIIFQNELLQNYRFLENVLHNPNKLPRRKRMEFEYDTFWFNEKHLEEIESLRYFIESEIPEKTKKFFLAVLSTVIKPCSYLDESQIKVKRDPKKILLGTPSPIELLTKNVDKYLEKLIQFNNKVQNKVSHEVYQESAENLNLQLIKQPVDLIVTSPPYINAMNYPMTHRYENLLLKLVDIDNYILHQKGYVGTERVYSKDYSVPRYIEFNNHQISDYLNSKLEIIYKREPKRSFIVYGYFVKMYEALKRLYELTKPEGYFVLVAGNVNTIRGVEIETFNTLIEIMECVGYKYETSFYYEIIKNAFKLDRHKTANLIKLDGVAVMRKEI